VKFNYTADLYVEHGAGCMSSSSFLFEKAILSPHADHATYMRYKNAMKSVRHSSGNGLICV